MSRQIHWSILAILFLSGPVFAREQLGELKVDNLVVRPQFYLIEPARADFQLGESLFSVRWDMDTKIGAVFTMGSKKLLGTTVHYTDSVNEDLGFIEAYGEFNFDYGTIRAGLQPVILGHEGGIGESDLELPRSLLYQRRIAPLRDVGLSYAIDYNNFFTRLMIHNGESGANKDGRLWYTARWGWSEPGFWRVGMAGQTGTTKPVSTNASNDTLAGVDPNKEAQWRMGGPFIIWTPHNWRVGLEGYQGELVQNKEIRKFSAAYLNMTYTGRKWFFAVRLDHFDPNHSIDRDVEHQISAGVGLLSDRRTSRIFLVATKQFEVGAQRPNDELRLIWHLTPLLPAKVPEL